VAETSGIFKSTDGDRVYSADFFREYFANFIGNGVYASPSDGLMVTSNSDMTVTVAIGKAFINGRYYYNDEALTFTLSTANSTLGRIDRVVLQSSEDDRIIKLTVLEGTASSSPSATALTQDEDTVYELGLADITVGAGVTTISQSKITDLRLDTDYCGVVTGTIDQIDTSDLFAQYEEEFNEWLETLETTLSDDVAGNLAVLITSNTSNMEAMIKIDKDITISNGSWVDDTADSGYYYYKITDTDVDEDTVVDFAVHIDYLDTVSIKNVTQSFDGYYYLYSDDAVDDDFIIDVKKIKEAS
jgi:hypothetical protein